jgi:hypothetical protein
MFAHIYDGDIMRNEDPSLSASRLSSCAPLHRDKVPTGLQRRESTRLLVVVINHKGDVGLSAKSRP